MNLEDIRSKKTKVILSYSIPAIIAMVLTSMITVVDGFFIGNYVGKEGLAAVNLGLPITYLFLAVGLMISVGGVAIAGMDLGAGEVEKCNNVFNQTIVTTIMIAVVLSIIVFLCFNPMLSVLHAERNVREYFKAYYIIMLFEMPIMIVNSSFGMFIRGDGNPQFFMVSNIINVALNCLFDYLFTCILHLGIAGIAMGSLIAAIVTLLVIISYFMKKSKVYKIRKFEFSKQVFRSTLFNGSSEFIGEMSLCISMFAYNYVIMRRIGVDGVTAFTIVGYVCFLFSMIVIGFGQGTSPLMSFTYGAKEYRLARSIRKQTNLFVILSGVITILIMLLALDWYSSLFVKSSNVKVMVESGIKIYMISFLFSGMNTITSFYFTSIGKAKESAIISSARGFVFLLIFIFTLPVLWGMTGIWMVAPLTEGITIIICIIFIYKEGRKNII